MRAVLLILWIVIGLQVGHANDKMTSITGEIERINSMRESLVGAVQGKVDQKTFGAVCKPVGQALKTFAKENGLKISQVSFRYRNPKHKPDKKQAQVLRRMEREEEITSVWMDEPQGLHYYRRIVVRAACLNCHGSKKARPQFIKDKYPADKAFGFKVGDLRGVYSVLIPKKRD